jgi:hypothetical protein
MIMFRVLGPATSLPGIAVISGANARRMAALRMNQLERPTREGECDRLGTKLAQTQRATAKDLVSGS